jgi:hypothetical protein
MLALLLTQIFAKTPSDLEDEDFKTEEGRHRPVMVVGSYLGFLWLLHHKKDHLPGTKNTNNSNTHNIPTLVVGYGDVFANHFYLGIEGEFGHGLKKNKDSDGVAERTRVHMGAFGHVGFYLSPSARLYGLVGFDKTNHVSEKEELVNGKATTKTDAAADGFAMSFGMGLLITMSSRFGFGFEGRYVPQKSWSGSLKETGTKVSAWQMGMKAILFI